MHGGWKRIIHNVGKLFTELKSYGERCKIFTHAKDALEFLENNYG